MTGFERFTEEQESFRTSKLFREKYDDFIMLLKSHCRGESNAMYDEAICEKLGIRSILLRSLVKYARREVQPIASNKNGYFWAYTYEGIAGTIKHLTERRDSLSYTISQLRGCFQDECQGNLFDE